MAIPDFLAYAARQAPSSFQSAISSGLSAYQTMQKQRLLEEQAQRQAALAPLQQQELQEKVREAPLAFKTTQQQAAQAQQLKAQQMAVANMKLNQGLHLMMGNRLADLGEIPLKQRAKGYSTVLNEMKGLGYNTAILPQTYGANAQTRIEQAQKKSPAAKAARKNINAQIIQLLKNRGTINAALIKAGKSPLGDDVHLGATTKIPGGTVTGLLMGTPPVPPPAGAVAPSVTAGPPTAAIAPSPAAAAAPVSYAPPPLKITPAPVTEKAYQTSLGTAFDKAQTAADTEAQHANSALLDIGTFAREAPQIPTGTGPVLGRLAWASAAGQQAIKAQNRLALTLLSLQKFGRVTNMEMNIVRNSTLNVHMKPEAWQHLGAQLASVAQRSIQHQAFLTAAASIGIRNPHQAEAIWNKFVNENHVIDARTGAVNHQNIGNWHKYLTPTYLRGELEAPAVRRKGFRFPGQPQGGGPK